MRGHTGEASTPFSSLDSGQANQEVSGPCTGKMASSLMMSEDGVIRDAGILKPFTPLCLESWDGNSEMPALLRV